MLGYERTAVGADAKERLAKEEGFYRDLHDGYRNHFARLDEPEGTVGVAEVSEFAVQAKLAEYEKALDVVVRGLASATVEGMTAVAGAAAPRRHRVAQRASDSRALAGHAAACDLLGSSAGPTTDRRARPRGYHLVAAIDLREELTRLRRLPVSGPLAAEPEPASAAPRASSNRLGFAVPDQFRISVTAYPGIRRGDLLETLLHELVHLHVGRRPGGYAWHQGMFKQTLRQAMREGPTASGPAGRPAPGTGYTRLPSRRSSRPTVCAATPSGGGNRSLHGRHGIASIAPACPA